MLGRAKNMFRFAPEGDNSGGGSPGTNPPTGGGSNPPEPVVTMSQAQLDQIMAQRGDQGKRAILKELGFESADEIKAALKKVAELEDAQKTEAQKLTEQAQKASERAAKAEQEREAAIARANETLMRSMVIVKAANFNDPADAWQFIDRAKVKVNEETGEVEGVDKAIEDLVKAKPYLLKTDAQTDKTKQRTQPQKPTGNKPAPTTTVPKVHL